jgi:hypothetical protein
MGQARAVKLYRQRAFLAAYAATASVKAAAAAAKLAFVTHYDWMTKDATYRAAFAAVQDQAAQALEDEAVRRAHEGVKRPVMYQGQPVKTGRGRSSRILYETEYSDQLLLALLKRFRPALYRERVTTEVSGSIDVIERLEAGRQRVLEMRAKEQAG